MDILISKQSASLFQLFEHFYIHIFIYPLTFSKQCSAFILITHYMEEVVDADRVIVMDDGHIVMDGTPKEIFSRVEELKQYRMDVPQVTELAWELKKKGIPLPDGILRKSELLDALVPLLKEE